MPDPTEPRNPRVDKKKVGGVSTYRKQIPLGGAPTPGAGYAVRQASKFGDVGTAQSMAGATSANQFKQKRQSRVGTKYNLGKSNLA